jgi:ABC-type sugar transport system ATPase subunit
MARVEFRDVDKVFPDGTHTVCRCSLDIPDGEFMVIVGPSGCGKSTLLRMLAGLEGVTRGEIRIGGRVVNRLSPQERNIAMVFQDYALYPHMSVRRNLEFPLRMQGANKAEIDRTVGDAARLLGLEDLLHRKPRQLSGGQRQRVAMGRAVVRRPSVFLMDEPLSNLDAKLRVQIRTEIAQLQQRLGITTLYVTHDQVEAMTLGQRVAVLRAGVLQQVAPPQVLYSRPANVFVATFLGSPGMNLVPAKVCAGGNGDASRATIQLPGDRWSVPSSRLPPALRRGLHAVLLGVRPETLRLIGPADAASVDTAPSASAAAADPASLPLTMTVEAAESLGHEHLIYGKAAGIDAFCKGEMEHSLAGALAAIDAPPGRLVARLAAGTDGASVSVGGTLRFHVGLHEVHLFDGDGGALLKDSAPKPQQGRSPPLPAGAVSAGEVSGGAAPPAAKTGA